MSEQVWLLADWLAAKRRRFGQRRLEGSAHSAARPLPPQGGFWRAGERDRAAAQGGRDGGERLRPAAAGWRARLVLRPESLRFRRRLRMRTAARGRSRRGRRRSWSRTGSAAASRFEQLGHAAGRAFCRSPGAQWRAAADRMCLRRADRAALFCNSPSGSLHRKREGFLLGSACTVGARQPAAQG